MPLYGKQAIMGVVPLQQRTSKCSQPFCNNQKMVVVAPIPNTYLMKRSLYITLEQTFRVTPPLSEQHFRHTFAPSNFLGTSTTSRQKKHSAKLVP